MRGVNGPAMEGFWHQPIGWGVRIRKGGDGALLHYYLDCCRGLGTCLVELCECSSARGLGPMTVHACEFEWTWSLDGRHHLLQLTVPSFGTFVSDDLFAKARHYTFVLAM